MQEIQDKIQQLLSQGENLLINIPKKSEYNILKQDIKNRYKLNEPLGTLGRDIISDGVSDLISDYIGGKKRRNKAIVTKAMEHRVKIQMENEINHVDKNFENLRSKSEKNYNEWLNKILQIVKQINCQTCLKTLNSSQQKVKLESKIRWGINSLKQAIIYLNKHSKKDLSLIKAGEPLKGRKVIKEYIQNAEEYIKLQEPYPSIEILELIELASPNVHCKLLIGPFSKESIKKEFERNLKLLRKVGRNIDVLSIISEKVAPFHDRYLITENKGIITGTSISGLGMRDSTINELNDWKDIEKRFDEYIKGPTTKHRSRFCEREIL